MKNKGLIKTYGAVATLALTLLLAGCGDKNGEGDLESHNVSSIQDPLEQKEVEISSLAEQIGDEELAKKAVENSLQSSEGIEEFYLYNINQQLAEDGKGTDLCFVFGPTPAEEMDNAGHEGESHDHFDYRSSEGVQEVCTTLDEKTDNVIINGGQGLQTPKVRVDKRNEKVMYTIDM